jgi:hypothetical protein
MQLVCAILWRHLWPLGLHHISRHCLKNGAIFGKKLLLIECVFWFSLQRLSKHFSFYEEFSEFSSKMWKRLHVKCPLFLSDFNETWIFSKDFRKKALKYQVSSKSVYWKPSCSIRTDVTKLIVAFRNFSNAPENRFYRNLVVIWIYTAKKMLVGRDSSVGIATGYGLDGLVIESRWGRDFPHPSRLYIVVVFLINKYYYAEESFLWWFFNLVFVLFYGLSVVVTAR